MVGKFWSASEERYFWRVLVCHSPRRLGVDMAKPEKSWAELARMMQNGMGDEALRNYTGAMLCDHFFRNVEDKQFSRHALKYVREYIAKRGKLSSEDAVNERSLVLIIALDRPCHLVSDSGVPHPSSESSINSASHHPSFCYGPPIMSNSQQQSDYMGSPSFCSGPPIMSNSQQQSHNMGSGQASPPTHSNIHDHENKAYDLEEGYTYNQDEPEEYEMTEEEMRQYVYLD
ncbi:hypothetical protein GGS24DRAFT_507603 [Hypoxylon argillaceum]|nr:hypothetical protein GGS24DRAFT_507603 [Hypoxylon argillaceum]